jgi:hypothetical protein
MTGSLSQLLDEQYAKTEAYTNAQILLFNVTVHPVSPSSDSDWDGTNDRQHHDAIASAVENLHNVREQVRSNLHSLQTNIDLQQRYPDHLALSRRILRTISHNPSWNSNGISSTGTSQDLLQINTVAMAALKASIANIIENQG